MQEDDADGLALEREFGWLQYDFHRYFKRGWDRCLKETGVGLSRQQSRVLTVLIRNPGMTQTALADEVEMEKAPLGRLLERLEERNLIERKPDPGDRRARRCFAKPETDNVVPEMRAAARAFFQTVFEDLSEAEIEQLMALMSKVKNNLVAAEQRACHKPDNALSDPEPSDP